MRDFISEIIETRNRQGQSVTLELIQELETLKNTWQENQLQREILRNYVPIRIATILEVFVRNWTASLIDHGDPFLTNAIGLSKNINVKFDLQLVSAMQGKRITIGEIISHSLSYNNVDQINSNLSTIFGKKLKSVFATARIRALDENFESHYYKITEDSDADYAALEKLFSTRHVIVHEIPEKFPATDNEIDIFLNAANRFAAALEVAFYTTLYGEMPLTQMEMNESAAKQHSEAQGELDDIFKNAMTETNSEELNISQEKWRAYMAAHCELVSRIKEPFPGSMAPMIYSSCATEMIKERLWKIKEYLDSISMM